jgi:transposase
MPAEYPSWDKSRNGGVGLDWRAKVELFESIRREYEFGVGTVRGVARKIGVHRRMVREAIRSAMPMARKKPDRPHRKLNSFIPLIEDMLEADRCAPRKQRHTAHRIWQRIRQEVPGCEVSERSIRKYVRKRRLALGLIGRETCVPQSYPWASEAQVDWYEAYADLGGERTCLQVFEMRSMASGGAFHRAYPRATQQAFLEAHELAFRRFGGVFRRIRYDNLKSAVKRILQGHRREETARFIAFRSHWKFESVFCSPGEAHEKGGIEGEGGYFRRNHWVPVPQAQNLEDLNEQLLAACYDDEQRKIAGRGMTVGQAILTEKGHLLPLVEEGFDLAEVSFPKVDGMGRVKVRTNFYSAPVRAGLEIQAKIYASYVDVWHEGQCVARHERCYSRLQEILDLEHYLEPLERKPGALAGSRPLEQWRQKGRWPASYDRIWEHLMLRNGRQSGTRHMIELLQLGKTHGYETLRRAVESALEMGSCDVSTVRYLMTAKQLDRSRVEPIDVGVLSCYERPLPAMTEYDLLLPPKEETA